MYIGGVDSRGYHHLLWELLDNAVDEAINGYASLITVTLHKDARSATVDDNGRGIPTGIMPKYNKSARIILTTLHAGGKFGGATTPTRAVCTASVPRWSMRSRPSSGCACVATARDRARLRPRHRPGTADRRRQGAWQRIEAVLPSRPRIFGEKKPSSTLSSCASA